MTKIPSVLFVCLGNICRSPMAEAAFRHALDTRGLTALVDSAGTGGWHAGDAPDPRGIRIAAAHGVDISDLRARQVHSSDFNDFDYILAMDEQNLANLRAAQPAGSSAKVSRLLDHVDGRQGQSVADPYYGGEAGFAQTWADVTAGAEALLDALTNDTA